jgi:hypothetical protein
MTPEERLKIHYDYILACRTEPISTGCMNWTGSTSKGYGIVKHEGTKWRVHRFIVYCNLSESARKDFLASDLVVIHTCDNPTCINPDHLRVATQSENITDAVSKGRSSSFGHVGEANSSAKLTVEEVQEIRTLYKTGNYSQRALARTFDVSQFVVYSIVNNKLWSHVI